MESWMERVRELYPLQEEGSLQHRKHWEDLLGHLSPSLNLLQVVSNQVGPVTLHASWVPGPGLVNIELNWKEEGRRQGFKRKNEKRWFICLYSTGCSFHECLQDTQHCAGLWKAGEIFDKGWREERTREMWRLLDEKKGRERGSSLLTYVTGVRHFTWDISFNPCDTRIKYTAIVKNTIVITDIFEVWSRGCLNANSIALCHTSSQDIVQINPLTDPYTAQCQFYFSDRNLETVEVLIIILSMYSVLGDGGMHSKRN